MKIWYGYGTEHSMNLVMIGTFKTEKDAKQIVSAFESLQLELQDAIEFETYRPRYDEKTMQILTKHKASLVAPHELDQFLFDIQISRDGKQIRFATDESDVSAYIKMMIDKGAKVEIFSAHSYPEETS